MIFFCLLASTTLIKLSYAKSFQFTNYTGGFVEPYVRNLRDGVSFTNLEEENATAMLELVSTKFSRIVLATVDASKAPFLGSVTDLYRNDSLIRAMFAGAPARINLKRNTTSLRVIIGVTNDHMYPEYTETEINYILDTARKANLIYPGTIEGMMFTKYDINSIELAEATLKWILKFKDPSLNLGLKIGTVQYCGNFEEHRQSELLVQSMFYEKILTAIHSIFRESNLIVCEYTPHVKFGNLGGKESFNQIRDEVLRDRSSIQAKNKDVEVAGYTYFPTNGRNIENLVEYWEEVDAFASKHNFQMFLPAFDNPYRKLDDAYLGWWRLIQNDPIGNVSTYLEKISELKSNSRNKMEKNPSLETILYIVAGVLIIVIFTIGACFLIFIHYKRKTALVQFPLTSKDIRDFLDGHDSKRVPGDISALSRPYDRNLEIPKQNLDIQKDEILGVGQFGCVFKARIIRDGNRVLDVALKTTKPDCPPTALKGLLSEIKILSHLGKHPNIIHILGAYTAELESGSVYVATELCDIGSLKNHLTVLRNEWEHENPTDNKFVKAIHRWSYEIACGMEYIAQKGVIHADLAARNVLLSSEGTAKISDFGLSRRFYDYEKYMKKTREALPWRWMAIESLKRMEFSTKTDVWSYGVTLWEIFSLGCQPHPNLLLNFDYIDKLEKGLQLQMPIHATKAMYRTMVSCWNMKPQERPTFSDLKAIAKQILDEQ